MTTQDQLAEFEAAFQRFSGGQEKLTRDALKNEMRALGFKPTDAELKEMIKEASSTGNTESISFTEFHTMLSDRMSRLDPADEIIQAFECFDPHMTGVISQKQFRDIFLELGGEKFTEREVRDLLKLAEGEESGQVSIVAIIHLMRKLTIIISGELQRFCWKDGWPQINNKYFVKEFQYISLSLIFNLSLYFGLFFSISFDFI
jgi:Ca2+-binding EF-hand superfamily protein